MGLFDFVKGAGEKLLGSEAEAAEVETTTVSPERVNELRGQSIVRMIDELGLEVEDLSVVVDGETAILEGRVGNQEACEKITLAAGNQYGVASVDCRLEVETPSDEARFYTVASGDTLGKIAKEFYGNAGKYMVIFEANQPMLKDPNKIYPGQVLRIPSLE